MKKLTVIVPAYNVEKFIIKNLESIKSQDVDDNLFDVLVIDDGSTDQTSSLVKKWISENKANNFQYIYKSNGNWGSVINYAKNNNLIKGKYVTILDADDFYLSNCFNKVFEIINQENDLIISNFLRLRNNKYLKTKVIYSLKSKLIKNKKSYTAWSLPICKFYKTSLFNSLSDLREGTFYQDQILFHSFVKKSQSIYFVKSYLGVYYENREGSSTTQLWDEKRIDLWCSNMNKLLSLKSKEINAYVMMMLNYCYKNTPKNLRFNVRINSLYVNDIKKSKFSWLPLGLGLMAKIIFSISNKKILKNSKFKN